MARLRREEHHPGDPAPWLARFRVADWFDPSEPVPPIHAHEPGLWRAIAARRRWAEARRAWLVGHDKPEGKQCPPGERGGKGSADRPEAEDSDQG